MLANDLDAKGKVVLNVEVEGGWLCGSCIIVGV